MGGVCVPRRFLIYLYWITRRIVTIVIKITSTKDVIPANKVGPTTIRIRYGTIIIDAATKIVIFSSWQRLKNTTTCLPRDTSERNPRTIDETKSHMDRTPYSRTSLQILNQPKEFVNKISLTREATRSHHKPIRTRTCERWNEQRNLRQCYPRAVGRRSEYVRPDRDDLTEQNQRVKTCYKQDIQE